jgi:hypothetical protein
MPTSTVKANPVITRQKGMKQTLPVTIPAAVGGIAGVFQLPARYRVFSCISTTGIYSAQAVLTDTPFTIDQAGRGFGSENGPLYGNLILTNMTAAPIQTTIYVGDTAIPQSVIANSVTVTATVGTTILTSQQFVTLVALAGTAQQLNAGVGNFQTATLFAFKTAALGANAGNIYIGASGGGRNQPLLMAPGDQQIITAPSFNFRRFQDFWINADNNGDGVVVIYS